jgi:hypothetical protein
MIEPDMVLRTNLGHLPTDGGDTVIATTPPGDLTPSFLRKLAVDMAAMVKCRVHHAEFVLTTDPAVVRTFGIFPMHDGCEQCEDGARRAVEFLERNPDSPVLVGRLYWADMTARCACCCSEVGLRPAPCGHLCCVVCRSLDHDQDCNRHDDDRREGEPCSGARSPSS